MKTPPPDLAARLLEVASHLGGTEFDVTIDEVAKLADVPRATLYYYFSGKDDLVSFFLNEKYSLVREAIASAGGTDGSVSERLARAMTAILESIDHHPQLCTELPLAVRRSGNRGELMANADRVMLAPLRELLIEGRATGELQVDDIELTATALMGALHFVGMMQITTTGKLDAEHVAASLVPQLIKGLRGSEESARAAGIAASSRRDAAGGRTR
jgi:AcrR family transcriptional regulator